MSLTGGQRRFAESDDDSAVTLRVLEQFRVQNVAYPVRLASHEPGETRESGEEEYIYSRLATDLAKKSQPAMHGDRIEQIQARNPRLVILDQFLDDRQREERRIEVTLLELALTTALRRMIA